MTSALPSQMKSSDYHEGYWERGEGSNYVVYGSDPGWSPTVTAMLEVLGAAPGKWLEVACAKGYFVAEARSRGVECHGQDISEYAVAQSPPSVRPFVACKNIADGCFWSGPFSVICSWEFLEHVPEPEVDTVLSVMESVLEPRGWLFHRIGIDLEGDPRWNRFATGGHNHQNDVTHYTERPRVWWEDRFRQRGWQRQPHAEDVLDSYLYDRDWWGRFFVWRIAER